MATAKNALTSRKTYSKYYGNFRGVDFSNDHTNISDSRFAYAVNMYRDYQSGQGVAIETIPGYRRLEFSDEDIPEKYKENRDLFDTIPIYGLHKYTFTRNSKIQSVIFIHKGTGLYAFDFEKVGGEQDKIVLSDIQFDTNQYYVLSDNNSISFNANNKLYILDGQKYICVEYDADYDLFEIHEVTEIAFIPTVYEGLKPNMNVEEIKEREVNQINLLTPFVKFTFVADGQTTQFDFPILSSDTSETTVKVYGEQYSNDGITITNKYIKFDTPPLAPENVEVGNFEMGYAGIEVTVKVTAGININGNNYTSGLITGCTLFAEYDGRIFLSGNPMCPNHLFWCGYSNGYADPTYWGILNYTVDGVGYSPITGMLTVADALMVLKANTAQDSTIYYHTPKESNIPISPTIYPSVAGLSGIGCLGACLNFRDDPIFVSQFGLEGIRTLSVLYERNIEHRSSLIDVKNLYVSQHSKLAEWNGYLLFLTNSGLFLADSRQKYTDATGATQYEWYWIDNIGLWDNGEHEYKFASSIAESIKDIEVTADIFNGPAGETRKLAAADRFYDEIYEEYYDARGMLRTNLKHGREIPIEQIYTDTVELTNEDGSQIEIEVKFTDAGTSKDTKCFFLLEEQPYLVNGDFFSADNIYSFSKNNSSYEDIYFTACGRVMKFNFDMRKLDGSFSKKAYSFDGRIINCGIATKMDNCGIPGYTKNTVKKSTVIKIKSLASSSAKIKVRTNKDPYKQVDRIQSAFLDLEDVDFTDFTFDTEGDTLFSIHEKEKKWVEKQYYIYSDEYEKPFSLYYIGYDYIIAGRYKENK